MLCVSDDSGALFLRRFFFALKKSGSVQHDPKKEEERRFIFGARPNYNKKTTTSVPFGSE